MNVILRRGWLFCLLFIFSGTAQAGTVIQFENYTPYGTLTDYGSNAASTPDVTISYRTFVPLDHSTYESFMRQWETGYGSLPAVAYASKASHGAEIGFTVSAGHTATIESFNLAGYYNFDGVSFYPTDRDSLYIQIVDSQGSNPTVLWNTNVLTANGTTYTQYTPNLTFSGSVYLQFSDNWNVGINDIAFHQDSSPVPEPSTLALLGISLLSLAGIVRSKR